MPTRKPKQNHIVYECGICGCYHPWTWDGDCRDDANRYGSPEEYAAAKGFDVDLLECERLYGAAVARVELESPPDQS